MKRILIIRLDRLGDSLLSLPLIHGLKTCWPDCEITVLASPRGRTVFEADPSISRLWEYDLPAMSLGDRIQLSLRIRREHFDIVFSLKENSWPTRWALMSGAPIRAGFDPGWLQFTHSAWCKISFTHSYYSPDRRNDPSAHEVERYAALAQMAGCPNANGPIRLFIPPEANSWAENELRKLLPTDSPAPISFHLSPKWAWEGWSEDSDLRVIQSIQATFPERLLIITAGVDEKNLTRRLEALPNQNFRLYEGLSIVEWGALLSHCGALVSMDTGIVHLASAVGAPVVDIFQTRHFASISTRWEPWKVPHRSILRRDPSTREKFHAEICSALRELLT